MMREVSWIPGATVPYGVPSLVASLVTLYPCGGRFYQLEAGDDLDVVAGEVLEAAVPGSSSPPGRQRYVQILRADQRWNARLYGPDLGRAFSERNGDALQALREQRWPAEHGRSLGLLWCPEITAWELSDVPLPLIQTTDPPPRVVDSLRRPK